MLAYRVGLRYRGPDPADPDGKAVAARNGRKHLVHGKQANLATRRILGEGRYRLQIRAGEKRE